MTTTENCLSDPNLKHYGIYLFEMATTGNCNKILSCVCGVNYLFEMTTTEIRLLRHFIEE